MTDIAPRPWKPALLLAALAEMLFLLHLTRPGTLVFDEVHYVPAARTLLSLDRPTNIEHPLLAKTLIAGGIRLFGDDAFGWRFGSTIAATATLLGLYAIAYLLFRNVRIAVLACLFAILNFTLFVQARIAMLDGYMMAFLTVGLAACLWAVSGAPAQRWWRWWAGAVLLGLATACKWAAAPYIAGIGAGVVLLGVARPGRLRGLGGWAGALAGLGVASIATYFATFWPAFLYRVEPLTWSTLIPFQRTMYAEQTQVLPHHTYQSPWWSWPVDYRGIWYLYEPVAGVQRGILLIGNPAIFWGGLVAIVACLWLAWRERSPRITAAAGLWILSYAPWVIIPKSLGFMYYYYPSSVFLCLPLAVALDRLGEFRWGRWSEWYAVGCLGLFAYFYPILSAGALPGPGAFHHWTLFDSWI